FGGPVDLLASSGSRGSARSRSQRRKNWVEPRDDVGLASDHPAVTSLECPNSSAGSHVHIMDLSRGELLCAPEIVYVIRVAAVDENDAGLQVRSKIGDGVVDNSRRYHQPNRSRFLKFLDYICKRRGANGHFLDKLVHRLR